MSDVLGAGVDVHCFPLLIASSRAAVCAPFWLRVVPESEAKTMTYLCRRAGCQRGPGGNRALLFIVINNDGEPRARAARRAKVAGVGAAFGLLGQTKNAFGDRALTDTEAAFSLARNGQASQPSPGSAPHASCVAPDHAPLRNKHQSTLDETCIVRI
jgi:hypothetical protein